MSCRYYTWNGSGIFGDYWCKKDNCRVCESDYRKYCRDYNYSECPVYKKSVSSGCFLTTIVCHVLGKEDNDIVLDKMRSFRDNVLHNDQKYIDILKDYDNIGPLIAQSIIMDQDKLLLANGLYPILKRITKKIDNQDYDKAINDYQVMTLSLINYYHLKHTYNDLKDKDYYLQEFNQETSGHGKKYTK